MCLFPKNKNNNNNKRSFFKVRNLAPSNVTQIETSIQENILEVQSVSVNLALEHIEVTLKEDAELISEDKSLNSLIVENTKNAIFLKIQNEITDNLGLEVTNMEEITIESAEGTFRKGNFFKN